MPRFLVVLPPPLDGDFSFSLFSGAVFEVGAALLNAEEKKRISKRGFGA